MAEELTVELPLSWRNVKGLRWLCTRQFVFSSAHHQHQRRFKSCPSTDCGMRRWQVGAIVVDGDAVKVTYAHNIDRSQTFGGCAPFCLPLRSDAEPCGHG